MIGHYNWYYLHTFTNRKTHYAQENHWESLVSLFKYWVFLHDYPGNRNEKVLIGLDLEKMHFTSTKYSAEFFYKRFYNKYEGFNLLGFFYAVYIIQSCYHGQDLWIQHSIQDQFVNKWHWENIFHYCYEKESR